MSTERHVLVQLDLDLVPGLLLKWSRNATKALVTYEVDSRVQTGWLAAELIRPIPD